MSLKSAVLVLAVAVPLWAQIVTPPPGGGGGGGSGTVTSVATGSCLTGGTITTTGTISFNGAINPETSTYQVIAADFSACKTITIASGTFTITLVSSGSQPAAGQYISIINYGSGTVTVAPSGQNLNGSASSITLGAGSASNPSSAFITSDGTNYFGSFGSALAIPITPTNGGTGASSSSATGVAQVNAGAWLWSTALANGTTATTQSPGDNTTKAATDAFVLANSGGCSKPSTYAPFGLPTAGVTVLVANASSANTGETYYFFAPCGYSGQHLNLLVSATGSSSAGAIFGVFSADGNFTALCVSSILTGSSISNAGTYQLTWASGSDVSAGTCSLPGSGYLFIMSSSDTSLTIGAVSVSQANTSPINKGTGYFYAQSAGSGDTFSAGTSSIAFVAAATFQGYIAAGFFPNNTNAPNVVFDK